MKGVTFEEDNCGVNKDVCSEEGGSCADKDDDEDEDDADEGDMAVGDFETGTDKFE